MVRNKRAWLRIIEATICTLIILGVVVMLYYGKNKDISDSSNQDIKIILSELSKNITLREFIINSSLQNKAPIELEITRFVTDKITTYGINLTSRVCDIAENLSTCSLGFELSNQKEIFTDSIIISTYSNATYFNYLETPRKIKVYYWEI